MTSQVHQACITSCCLHHFNYSRRRKKQQQQNDYNLLDKTGGWKRWYVSSSCADWLNVACHSNLGDIWIDQTLRGCTRIDEMNQDTDLGFARCSARTWWLARPPRPPCPSAVAPGRSGPWSSKARCSYLGEEEGVLFSLKPFSVWLVSLRKEYFSVWSHFLFHWYHCGRSTFQPEVIFCFTGIIDKRSIFQFEVIFCFTGITDKRTGKRQHAPCSDITSNLTTTLKDRMQWQSKLTS